MLEEGVGGIGIASLGVGDGEEGGGVFNLVSGEADAGGAGEVVGGLLWLFREEGDPAGADGEDYIVGETEEADAEDFGGLVGISIFEGAVGGF